MKKSAEKIGQLLNYEKLSNIELLKLPQVEKKDIPAYINCPKYEKAKGKIDKAMERHAGKADKLKNEIRSMKASIASKKEELEVVQSSMDSCKSKIPPYDVIQTDHTISKFNRLVAVNNDLIDQIRKLSEKHDDTIDKLTEAEEETKEKLEELTDDALEVVDEDISAVINRLEGIADNFSGSENIDNLFAAIDVYFMGLRIYAMFDDLIDDNNARKECKEGIEKISKIFANLCTNDSVQNYTVDIHKRNLDLMQNNTEISKQIDAVLDAVDQKQIDVFIQSINTMLAEKFNTNFNYSKVLRTGELNRMIGEINDVIASLKSNLDKAKEFQRAEAPSAILGKVGVKADQKAKSLRATMQSSVDTLGDLLTQNHFAVQIIDEAAIDDFQQKDLRVAVSTLRKHIADTIGERCFESILKGGDDRFLLKKPKPQSKKPI
jgi:prefoldin subunit 5